MVVPNGPSFAAHRIDMDPLVVAGGIGEQVDARLVDGEPVGRAKVGAGHGEQVARMGDDRRHARWLDTDRISPVM